MFNLKENEELCDYCIRIVEKPHDCSVLKERLARRAEEEKYEANVGPSIVWNCGGSTRGFGGGPGTGIPSMKNINPGNDGCTLASLGLSAEHGRKLGIL